MKSFPIWGQRYFFGLICLVIGLCECAVAPAHAATPLPPSVVQSLESAQIPLSSVAVWAQPLEGPESVSLEWNADTLMNPASVMKLPTTFAALEKLGSAYTWTTRLATEARIQHGKLEGNLYLVGSGDPVFYYEKLWKLLRQLRQLGVDEIAGDVILDASTLHLPPHDPGAFDNKPLRPYNAGPDGLLINFNALRITLLPNPGGTQPITLNDPPLAGVKVINQIRTQPGSCGVWFRDLGAQVHMQGSSRTVTLTGIWHDDCGPKDWEVAPLPTADFNATLFTSLWAELGGRLAGRFYFGTTPANARTLLTNESPPLGDVVRDMNKWSSNQIARQIQVTLARESNPNATDMADRGNQIILTTLGENGIPNSGWVVGNGAGLSRESRLTARGLGALLLKTWTKPFMGEFLASLPIAGVDGTARKRLAGSGVQGRAWLKTGTMDAVSAVGGYVQDKSNRRWAVVMLVNHANAGASRAAQDALIQWVWDHGTAASQFTKMPP